MANHNKSLAALCSCLRGEAPKNIDWFSLIGLANDTLTTPALMSFVDRFENVIPPHVRDYIREMFVRNQLRNQRLSNQLGEALMALNGVGVTPVLLKGAATLATAESAVNVARLISDLDIMISTEEIEAALEVLFALGYRVFFQAPKGAAKWYVDLERDGDVGMIDLHQRLPGHDYFYSSLGNVRQHCSLTMTRLGPAYVPLPTYQALILIVHDQFQDSDYWTGNIDLRHLLDLCELASSAGGIDWKLLSAISSSRLYRNALETQLVALHSLFDVDVPRELLTRLTPRLQFRRRLIQSRIPLLRPALLAAALLDYTNYRAEVGAEERTTKTSKPQKWSFPKIHNVRHLLDLSAEKRPGKV
jgi:Uncharacterised nucleotidyltransferase